MFCNNCGAELEEGTVFCPECGQRQDETPVEQKDVQQENGGVVEGVSAAAAAVPKKKSGLVPILLVAVVLLAVVCGGVFACLKMGGKKSPFIYLKDNELVSYKGKAPYKIDDDIFANRDEYSLGYRTVQLTEDNKYIFYPEDYAMDYSNYVYTYDLYAKQLDSEKAEAEKIDTGVSSYHVIDRKHVIYLKGKNQKLYYYNKGTKDSFASKVRRFYVSDDKKYVMWESVDNNLYVQNIAKQDEKITIAREIDELVAHSDDFKRILYRREGALYFAKNLEDAEKIATDVDGVYVCNIDTSMEVYFTVDERDKSADVWDTEKVPDVSAWVIDEYAKGDANMKKPMIGAYSTMTEYNDAYAEYNEKENRDRIRRSVYRQLSNGEKKLCYYSEKDGNKTTIFEGEIVDYFHSSPVYVIQCYNESAADKVSMETLMSVQNQDFSDRLEEVYNSGMEMTLFYQGEGKKIDFGVDSALRMKDMRADKDQSKTYIAVYDRDEEEYSLWKMDYTKSALKPEKVIEGEEDRIVIVGVTDDGVLSCLYDTGEEQEASLYLNDKEIDTDVNSEMVSVRKGDVYYYTDYSDKSESGTLRRYSGKKAQTIVDDVYTYRVNDEGKIALLVDYSTQRHYGELKLYYKGKTQKIDSDVTRILFF